MANKSKNVPSLVWQGVELPRVPPGGYRAACVGFQGPEWVRAYRRWSVRLEFSLLSDDVMVSAFFNMGNDPAKLQIGRRSRFYKAWCMANREPPRRGQQMSLDTFTEEGLLYLVQVEDALMDGKGESKPDALIYSRVVEILSIDYC